MRVSGILANKGSSVATIAPQASIAEAAFELRSRGIGALVVSTDGHSIDGIISERDVVQGLATYGQKILDASVSSVMSTEVWTCSPDDSVEMLMHTMTDRRTRHLPVTAGGALAGIISIGDVVKERLGELEDEARHLTEYITTGR